MHYLNDYRYYFFTEHISIFQRRIMPYALICSVLLIINTFTIDEYYLSSILYVIIRKLILCNALIILPGIIMTSLIKLSHRAIVNIRIFYLLMMVILIPCYTTMHIFNQYDFNLHILVIIISVIAITCLSAIIMSFIDLHLEIISNKHKLAEMTAVSGRNN